jgi:hypothetical protein
MKSKPLIFFILVELSIIITGSILGFLILRTKETVENIECSLDCCESDNGDDNGEDNGDKNGDSDGDSSTDSEENENIKVTSPKPNDIVTSPLVVTGEAKGTWYFEGDFPVDLYDENCIKIAAHYAVAKEFSMVDYFVPFEGTIEFDPGDSATGTLVLEKDNPTGCIQFDDNLVIPVQFK